MIDCPYKVGDFISGFTLNPSLNKAIAKIKDKIHKFHSSKFIATKENSRHKLKLLHSKLKKRIIDDFKISSFFYKSNIIAYPDSDIYELYNIMTQLGISKIPVATNPWNKKLIGFINIKTLEKVLDYN